MKKILVWLCCLVLAGSLIPGAKAEGASLLCPLPTEIQEFFSRPQYAGWELGEQGYAECRATIGGDFAFCLLTKGRQSALYGFEYQQGKWQYWLKTSSALPAMAADGSESLRLQGYATGEFDIVLWNETMGRNHFSLLFEPNAYGQWHLSSVFSWEAEAYHIEVSPRSLFYRRLPRNQYTDAGERVPGVVETNLRYFDFASFPLTKQEAERVLSLPPEMPAGSQLRPVEVRYEKGRKFPVYAGPGSSYPRLGNGKAAVSTNDWIQTFGRENGFVLIQYDLNADQNRFGYISEKALPKNHQVPLLSFADLEAELLFDTPLTDDPLKNAGPILNLKAGQQGIRYLAAMGRWAYVEAEQVRGFLPLSALRFPIRASHQLPGFSAEGTATISREGIFSASIQLTSQKKAARYELWANQMPIPARIEVSERLAEGASYAAQITVTASLPKGASVASLCPVWADGTRAAAEMLIFPLSVMAE